MTAPESGATRLIAVYRIRSDAPSIATRAQAIAVEQSVEMPVSAIDDPRILSDIVGRVESIADRGDGSFEVRIALSLATTGFESGQLMNMLFGNTSIQEDVSLDDVILPRDLVRAFPGPGHGVDGLRRLCGTKARALTCSALKPQGLPPEALAAIAGRLAAGGLDFIKDDHGLADQSYSPFARRVPLCAKAVRQASAATGVATQYVPSLSGHLDKLREETRLARDEGIRAVLIAPMVVGIPSLAALVAEFPDMAFIAHPALAGAARIASSLLLGKLFRLFGADATIFPNHGGRFSYTRETCGQLAGAARAPWHGIRPCLPVPAGGMVLVRVDEMLDFYGPDVMLLIGGGLLSARDGLAEAASAFVERVAQHRYQ